MSKSRLSPITFDQYEQSAPASVKAGWRRIGWMLFCFALVGACIALLSPTHVLDEVESAKAICLWVTHSVAPSIPKYAHISAIPQVTTIYLTAMTLFAPVVVLASLRFMPLRDYAYFDWSHTKSANARRYKYFLGPIFMAILAWGIMVGVSDFSAVDGRAHAFRSLMVGSRFGLAIFGGFGMVCFCLVLLYLVLLLITPISVFLGKSKTFNSNQ